jgi:AbrB family looped-hinge helix DNA binding protein
VGKFISYLFCISLWWDFLEIIVREKGRITLPLEIRKALALREGDKLELLIENGVIILKPKEVVRAKDLKGIISPIKVDLEEIEEAPGKV